MSMLDPLAIAGYVASAFERLGVRYVLGGSLASTTLGEPRATMDVDLVADLTMGTLGPWLDSLGVDFTVDRDWARQEVARRGSFQVLHLPSLLRIDVFVPPWEGVHLWKWQRRRRISIDATIQLDVTAPEGIVVQKLAWFRSGGEMSDRQWRDVLGVLKAQRGGLEIEEMQRWAAAVGVADLLDRAMRQADVGPGRQP